MIKVELIQGGGMRLLAALGWRHSSEQGHPDQVRAQSKGSGQASKSMMDSGGEEDEWGRAGAVCRLSWAVPGVCALSLGPNQGQHPVSIPQPSLREGDPVCRLRPRKRFFPGQP